MDGTYTLAEVAHLLQEAFPDREVKVASLRAALHRPSPAVGATSAMPARLPGSRIRFAAVDVERWIAEEHPWRLDELAARRFAEAWLAGDRAGAITQARQAGLSWDQMAHARAGLPGERRVGREAMRTLARRLLADAEDGG